MGMEGQTTDRAPQHLCNDRLDCQPEVKAWYMEQDSQHGTVGGFSASPSADGAVEGVYEPTEDEIAEKIYSWWISGLSYSEWYAETYLQLKIDFGEDLDNEENGR